MTPKQLAQKLRRFANDAKQVYNESAVEAGTQVIRDMRRRIFQEGEDSNDSKIGDYSTRGFLAPTDAFINSGAIAKFKPTKDGKFVFVPGGYKQFRQVQGFQTGYVDLEYRGDLRRSIRLEERNNVISIVIIGNDNIKKAKDNEDRFGKDIFSASEEEKREAKLIFEENFTKLLRSYIDG